MNGFDVQQHPEEVRKIIGVVNGGMGLPARLTGREVLQSFAGLYGMTEGQTKARIAELDQRLDLGRTLDVKAGEYSTGMKQKVVIARAVIHDPAVLVLDEAASGLDIFARRTLLDFVAQTRAPGRLTLYSTHVMSEAEEVCDRVAILHQGQLVRVGSIPAILQETGESNLERAFFALLRGGDAHAVDRGRHQRRRGTDAHLRGEGRQGQDVGPGNAAVQHVAADDDALIVDRAAAPADGQRVEQCLRRVFVPPVAGV